MLCSVYFIMRFRSIIYSNSYKSSNYALVLWWTIRIFLSSQIRNISRYLVSFPLFFNVDWWIICFRINFSIIIFRNTSDETTGYYKIPVVFNDLLQENHRTLCLYSYILLNKGFTGNIFSKNCYSIMIWVRIISIFPKNC